MKKYSTGVNIKYYNVTAGLLEEITLLNSHLYILSDGTPSSNDPQNMEAKFASHSFQCFNTLNYLNTW